MSSSANEITLYGVLVGAVLPLLGYIVFHRLASHREKESRIAKAANDFRTRVLDAIVGVPTADVYWDNDVLAKLPNVLSNVEMAVNIYSYFLPEPKKRAFYIVFEKFQGLVQSDIPKALSKENVMYGGGQHTPEEARNSFHQSIKELLEYAQKT